MNSPVSNKGRCLMCGSDDLTTGYAPNTPGYQPEAQSIGLAVCGFAMFCSIVVGLTAYNPASQTLAWTLFFLFLTAAIFIAAGRAHLSRAYMVCKKCGYRWKA